ncbi:hypothetical protein CP980_04880 [Streptomyces vinaceus]|uniref:Uncharacterized protein n=1 Tax=Streptomyces vinaceus TaxID=1960 RepID=A0A5J6J300_STRVI|nr:hypothetical protein CP980_04880 [Streptomyces vinaceus]GHE26560.1 hypothetical protein GCM10017778_04890 [Streptomyces vinaceus]
MAAPLTGWLRFILAVAGGAHQRVAAESAGYGPRLGASLPSWLPRRGGRRCDRGGVGRDRSGRAAFGERTWHVLLLLRRPPGVGAVGQRGSAIDPATGRSAADAIRTWDCDHRGRQADFELQPLKTPAPEVSRQFSIDAPLNRIVISWN